MIIDMAEVLCITLSYRQEFLDIPDEKHWMLFPFLSTKIALFQMYGGQVGMEVIIKDTDGATHTWFHFDLRPDFEWPVSPQSGGKGFF